MHTLTWTDHLRCSYTVLYIIIKSFPHFILFPFLNEHSIYTQVRNNTTDFQLMKIQFYLKYEHINTCVNN